LQRIKVRAPFCRIQWQRADPRATDEGLRRYAQLAVGFPRTKVVEHLHQTAKLADWHRVHGRHRIIANGALVQIRSKRDIERQQQVPTELVASSSAAFRWTVRKRWARRELTKDGRSGARRQ
jgi:hypothetical protein